MNEIYVLTSRKGNSISKPQVFFKLEKAQEQMKEEYNNSLIDYEDTDFVEWNEIKEETATIATTGDWVEWFIDKCIIN